MSAMVDVTLASRSDHLDVVGSGFGITEHSLHGEASAEVNALLDWVLPRLEKGIHPPSKLDEVRRPNA
jgi:hypothetical protein